MKTSIVVLLVVLIASIVRAEFVTLVSENSSSPVTYELAENEAAKITISRNSRPDIRIYKNGIDFDLTAGVANYDNLSGGQAYLYALDETIAGPATIEVKSRSSVLASFVTFEVVPEATAPDKTIVIPAGTDGIHVQLEQSTDLIFWEPATNGVYGSTNASHHLFFRIRSSTVP